VSYLLLNCLTCILTFGDQISVVYHSISSSVCIVVGSGIFWSFQTRDVTKQQHSVVTSTCNAEYMALALATNQWIKLTNTIGELNVPVIHAAMFCDKRRRPPSLTNTKLVIDLNITTLPMIWYVRLLNLIRFLHFWVNWLPIWPISILKDFYR
jgi:hypothetical protein